MRNALIEEYKTLRDEIITHIKLKRQMVGLSGTVVVIAITFCEKTAASISYDLLGVLLLILLVPIFLVYRAECFSIAKIASYIEKRIESKVEGLNWAGANINRPSRRGLRIFDIRSSTTEAMYFLMLLMVSWGVPCYLKKSSLSTVAIIIMSMFSCVYLFNAFLVFKYYSYRKDCDDMWVIKNEENKK